MTSARIRCSRFFAIPRPFQIGLSKRSQPIPSHNKEFGTPHCVPAKRRAIATNTTCESPRRAGRNSLAVSFRVAVTIAAAVVSISAFAGRQAPLPYFLQ
jgi:hypothetical protein